jgi:ABC-type multidrug transport system fused ATPase/permease subunit
MSKNDIIQNNKIDYEIIYTWNHIDQAHMYTMQQSKYLGRMHNIPRTIVSIFRIVIVIIWWTLYLQNNISLGYVLALLSFVLLIDKAVIDFVKSYKDFTKDLNIVQRLWQMIDDTPRQKDYNIWSSFIYKSWNIHIHNLNFSYGSNNVFSDFDLQIQGWTKTAFVGESWGGKTTLIKLLAGYIRPDSGDIEIDGQKLSEVKLIDYYKHIGYLTQDPSVFDGTIYENLVYALDTEPAKEELEKVVNLAKCEFIREFEKWLETEIGERWVRLSGWQKQRLAIAKIMLKNPNIILLDEPTSALDSFNEELINIALHNLFKGKTVIVVAHRLQTVKQADRILMIEHGNIIEQGTHDQLVKLNGKYKKMLDLQSGF